MKKRKLKIDVLSLVRIIMSLPCPSNYNGDKYTVCAIQFGIISVLTFIKENDKWLLLMDSDIVDTSALHGREFNGGWINECTPIDKGEYEMISSRAQLDEYFLSPSGKKAPIKQYVSK